jgi:hypothetical protein
MKTAHRISWTVLIVVFSLGSASAERDIPLGDNAALRYWAAFAQMQDSAITDQQAKELNAIVDGTAPYDDSNYKNLVEKNKSAIEAMARATALPNCDWGLDYQLGSETPVDYVRKALALGRLNVLYTFHLLIAGDRDSAVRALTSGLRFSRDVANGGSLFAAVVAKDLLVSHLGAVAFAVRAGDLSAAQRRALQKAMAQLGPDGLDWQLAMNRELHISHEMDSRASAALARIIPVYIVALSDPSMLPKLEQMRASAPQPLPDIIPNPKRVREEKQDLSDKILQTRASLQ